jgi:uncharacterized protein
MLASLRWFVTPAVLAGLIALTAAPPGRADGPPDGFRIKDGAKLFSQEAMDKAEKTIAKVKREYKQDLLVETYAEIPESLLPKYKAEQKRAFFSNWARDRYNQAKVSGVLILVCKDPTYIFTEEGKQTGKRAFTEQNAQAVSDLMAKHFKERDFDGGLLAAVEYVDTTIRRHGGASASAAGSAGKTSAVTKDLKEEAASMPIAGWICLGLGALLVLWIVVGLVRAITGAGRPQQGYGPPGQPAGHYGPGGPPPGYGPGYGAPAPQGGGFMQGLLGGMLGGAAGAWAYNSFFGSGSGGMGGMTPPAYGGTTPAAPDNSAGGGGGADWGATAPADNTGGADWGGGGDTGGADWGAGGGEAGGGADWGGGGDDGGGADWGGGGDAGGGDWGGGGGGDGGSDW